MPGPVEKISEGAAARLTSHPSLLSRGQYSSGEFGGSSQVQLSTQNLVLDISGPEKWQASVREAQVGSLIATQNSDVTPQSFHCKTCGYAGLFCISGEP